jgi:cation transport protein ChaC
MRLDEFMARLPKGEFWVFGYASLMWSPCFPYEAKAPGRAHGYHRALCILSTRYRGTRRRPGLVMGLCQGGSCWGVAFRIHRRNVLRTLRRLWAREMPRRVYDPRLVVVRLRGGRTVKALAFVADPTHSSYVGELDLHRRARLVAQGIGVRGPNIDYIQNTLDHMHDVGVRDPHLERVLHAALALRRGDGGAHARKGLAQARTLRAKVQPHEARRAKLRSRR